MSVATRIAVVGCGALGSYYGACLARAGHDVRLLLRSDFDVVRQRGVEIRSGDGGFRVHPVAARTPEEIGPCDLVLIGLKTTANAEFPRLLPPLLGPDTAVLTLQNGLGSEETLALEFGAERVLGGLCFVCLNRIAPGVVVHHAYGRIMLGEYRRPASERARRIAGWFQAAGVSCEVVEDLERAHWEKLVWNIPFNGLGVAAAAGYESVLAGRPLQGPPWGECAPTDRLLGDERWTELVRELMAETIAGARAQGLSVDPSAAETQIRRTRAMGSYKASTLVDFERRLPLEVECLFGEPLRRIRAAGVEAPRLSGLHAVLEAMDRSLAAGRD
ncbi:MAG: 2-dehydropantoate 2-reductase [Limisphaerales bacterium]